MALSEFSLIERYFAPLGVAADQARGVILGIGDDCALLTTPPGHQLAISIDTLVQGSHFLPDITPAQLARRAFAACVSDLAGMGAQPRWMTLALTLPQIDESWLEGFSEALAQQLREFDMLLVGGDTTKGATLTVTLQVHGWVPAGEALRRDGARAGDHIFVTGTLGDAMAGLEQLQQPSQLQTPPTQDLLRERFFHPTPRIGTGIALRPFASAAVDISDGLLADLGHILERSDSDGQPLGAIIELAKLPLSDALCSTQPLTKAQQLALSGGEDFELCFTVPEHKLAAFQAAFADHPVPCTCIGRLTDTRGLQLQQPDGTRQTSDTLGFKHF